MNNIEYKFLMIFPSNRDKITKEELNEKASKHNLIVPDVDRLIKIFRGVCIDGDNEVGFNINLIGLGRIMEYQEEKVKTDEESSLSIDKLRYETKIAKWTYRTYWVAFFLSIAAVIISIIALLKKG